MNHRKANRMTVGFRREQHGMTRIDIDTGIPFAQFVAAFEKAAPPVDRTTLERIAKDGGDWDDVRAAAAENAPNDLMMYAKIETSVFFSVAGHRTHAIEYLVGNHVIAETMFRHDAKALLYAPLRMLVYSDADGDAVFTMDQPGPAFGSLGIAEVAAVGKDLDRKVVNLLRVVGVDAGQAFG
ncbi:DUF302 domain-containing protein [Mycobacterium sp.]|uniref:DUF302 domain-containing protein n=1 Tax=Mycobacterium sp. TaxID=1785 RepID=UPI003C78CAD8